MANGMTWACSSAELPTRALSCCTPAHRVTGVGLAGMSFVRGELMTKPTTDASISRKIEGLVHEEQHLYKKSRLADHDQVRLEDIKVELDQCWDLLRQRDARREFGQDPDEAKVRPASVVERYKQ